MAFEGIPQVQKTEFTKVLPVVSGAQGLNAQIEALGQVQSAAGRIAGSVSNQALQFNKLQLSQSIQHLNNLHSDIVNSAISSKGHIDEGDIDNYQKSSDAYIQNIHILPGNEQYANALLGQTVSNNVNSMGRKNALYQFQNTKSLALSSINNLSIESSNQFQNGNYKNGLLTLGNASDQIDSAQDEGILQPLEADRLKYQIQTSGKVNYYVSQFKRALQNKTQRQFLTTLNKQGIPNTTLDQRNKIFNAMAREQKQFNIVNSSQIAINKASVNSYIGGIKSGEITADDKTTSSLVNNLPTKDQNTNYLKIDGAVYQRNVTNRLLELPLENWDKAKSFAFKNSSNNPFAQQDIAKINTDELKNKVLNDPVGVLSSSNDFTKTKDSYVKSQVSKNTAQGVTQTPEEIGVQFNRNYQKNQLNIPANKIESLSKSQAQGLASQLINAPTLNDQLPILQSIKQTYGSQSQNVLQQLYNAGAKNASPLYVSAIQTPLGMNYNRALEAAYQSGPKSSQLLQTQTDKAVIDSRIDKNMQSFVNSLPYNNVSDNDLLSIKNQVRNFAYALDGEGKLKGTTLSQKFDGWTGNNAKEAADVATDTLINQHFQFKTGNYISINLPKGLTTSLSQIKDDSLTTFAKYNLRLPPDVSLDNVMKQSVNKIGKNIREMNFELPKSILHLNPDANIDTLKKNYANELIKNGQYITTPDNKSVIFVDSLGSPLRNEEGQVYQVNFEDTK